MKVNTLVVHRNPHLDELVAVWLLRNFGEKMFPGIRAAKLETAGKTELAQMTPEMAALSGRLLVGLGGGMFDDHKADRPDCATSLVATHLGVRNDKKLKMLVEGVYRADSANEGLYQYLAAMVKDLNRYWGGSVDVERLYEQFEPFITAMVARQVEFLEAQGLVQSKYRSKIGEIKIAAANGIDNRQFQHAARLAGAKVIIQRNEAGLTQILGSEELDMPGLAARIRRHELYKSNLSIRRRLTDEELTAFGTLAEIPHWYLDKGNLLNGSESFPDTPASGIPFGDVVRIVEKHLEELLAVSAPAGEQQVA